MARRSWLVAGLFAVAIAMVAAFPAIASAAYTNADCTGCHASSLGVVPAQNFNVGSVDFDTACKKCHDDSLAGSHPYHNTTANCGGVCHDGWGASLGSAIPTHLDSRGYGAFASATSADTDPALLHVIHSKPRWMESKQFSFSTCGSCHAVATCDSCHDNPPAPDSATHASHAASMPLTPWIGNTSSGVTAGDQTENTYVVNNAVRCGAAGCHDTTGVASSAPGLHDDKSHIANTDLGYLTNVVTKTGLWKIVGSSAYTMFQISQSNAVNATLSIPFTGEQISLISDKDPYRGIAQIIIDNRPPVTVDMYQETTQNQVVVYKSPLLASGEHTITVKVTNTKRAAARATFVRVDQFKVYNRVPGKVAPNCTSCHPGNADAHGIGNFSHEATGTAAGMVSGSRCDSCHSMAFLTEHNRLSSASAGESCANCHTNIDPVTLAPYAPTTWSGTWSTTDGCNFGACHQTTTPRQPHTAIVPSHAVTSDPAEASCRGCHAGDLAVIHANSVAGQTVTNCNTCHTLTKYPATKSCTSALCHGGTGVRSVDQHNYDGAPEHTAAPWTTVYQGSGPSVSTGGKECSTCHSAELRTAHATTSVGKVGCSSGGTGNTGCHDNTSLTSRTVASTNWLQKRCTQCHNSGTKTSHDSTFTPHAVDAGSCAGTATGCHTSKDLWTLHSKSYAGTAPKYSSCANTGCHSAGNVDKRPTLKTCGTNNECHTDKDLGTHPGAKDHGYTAASDYNATTDTGCSNSGAGCHGTDATRADMAVPYHPTSGCVGGPCHQSASKPAYVGNNDCVTCHDNNYLGAPDRVALTSAYPNGHYSETTHTAGGAGTTVAAGGSATATCANCHNGVSATGVDGLRAQHQGLAVSQVTSATYANVACAECHGYSPAMTAIVNLSWPTKTCSACHTGTAGLAQIAHGTTAPVVNTTSTSSCGASGVNCHTTYDVHALHKDAGGCALTGCHDYSKQGANPTLTACGQAGGCHASYTASTAFPTHGAVSMETTDHAPTLGNTAQQSANLYQGIACGSCHIVAGVDGGLIAGGGHERVGVHADSDGAFACR